MFFQAWFNQHLQDLRGVQRGRGMHRAGCRGHAADDNPGYHAAPDLRGAELGCLLEKREEKEDIFEDVYIQYIYICINRYIYIYYVFICLYHMKIDEDIKTYEN